MKEELENSLKALKSGNVILYPTDTVWGLGGDATNPDTAALIFKMKQRQDSKSMIILVDGVSMLESYVGEVTEDVLKLAIRPEKPTTLIYNNPKGLAMNVVSADNTVAIRIVQHEFCRQLIKAFKKPIISTSANVSGRPTPMCYDEIDPVILDAVDYSVNLQREQVSTKSSTIIKINADSSLSVLRK